MAAVFGGANQWLPYGAAKGAVNSLTLGLATPLMAQDEGAIDKRHDIYYDAKTGTLDQVSGLAGYTPTADGGLLAFAFLGNELPRDQDSRAWFDHVGAALAGCHCVA